MYNNKQISKREIDRTVNKRPELTKSASDILPTLITSTTLKRKIPLLKREPNLYLSNWQHCNQPL